MRRLLENVTRMYDRLRENCRRDKSDAAASEAAVAEIALMIAALDGVVLPEEYAAYRWISSRCAELSGAEDRGLREETAGKAGGLLLMAQVGAYTEAERLSAFGKIVREALPNGFDGRSRTDVRRSFVLWLAMAVSDGVFSGIERPALESLGESLDVANAIESGFFETAERLLRTMADPKDRSDAEAALDELVIFGSQAH